jgi:hypothetical protein
MIVWIPEMQYICGKCFTVYFFRNKTVQQHSLYFLNHEKNKRTELRFLLMYNVRWNSTDSRFIRFIYNMNCIVIDYWSSAFKSLCLKLKT